MTPDQIIQLRQFIKNWQTEAGKYITKTKFEAVLVDVINIKCDSLLALLPYPTSNGTKQVLKPMPREPHPCNYVNFKRAERTISCPDCQLPEEMRVLKYGIAQDDGKSCFGFWDGPNPSLQEMLDVDGRDENSVIWRFNPDGTDDLIYRWDGDEWMEVEKGKER